VKQADFRILGTCSRKASKSVSTFTVVVYPDPLSAAPSTPSAVKTPQNTDPDDPELADEGDT
jgi:hypothetical protein